MPYDGLLSDYTKPLTVADVLNRAADLIERDGWCQGGVKTMDGRRCIVGAIKESAGGDSLDHLWRNCPLAIPAVRAFDRSIDILDSLPAWNDTPGRTAAEVISALRAAASAS